MRFHYLTALAITFLFGIGRAQATLTNGGFETGDFTGWSIIGDTLVVEASIGTPPAVGTYQALITNAPGFGFGYEPHPDPYSGTPSITMDIQSGVLETFLGLPTGALTSFYIFAWQGSAIKQSFVASQGDILSLRWNFLTNELFSLDYAFIVLDGAFTFLADPSFASPGSGTTFLNESGYHTFATTITSAGSSHYVGIGVVDTFDHLINSGILVDNFTIRSVPEPASWLLLFSGVTVLVGSAHRKSRRPDAETRARG